MHLSFLFAFVVVGIGLGAVVGWVLSRRRSGVEIDTSRREAAALVDRLREQQARMEALRYEGSEAQRTIARMEEQATRLPELRDEIAFLRQGRNQLEERFQAAQRELVQVRADLAHERCQSTEKLAILTGAREELTNQFKALASEILEEKSKRFSAENQASIGHLLDPLKTRLTEFQSKVEEVQKEGIAGRSELRTHLGELKSLNERFSSDATNFVNALKGSSKTQGDWGESILEMTLNSCGLRKGHHYRVQETFDSGEGRSRPDVIVDLPGGRHLVIDAKVSLLHYNNYCSSENEPQRKVSLAAHLASIRAHIKDLSRRNYQSIHQLNSLDFVVMFIPIEPAFLLAIGQDRSLLEEAWNKNILLVSHSTLLFALRTVKELWRQEAQVRNVQEIVDRGRELYDKLASFAKDLSEVGAKLNAARDSYDDAVKKLSTGRGNAIRQAELLKSLGVKPTKSMPLAMLDDASADYLLDDSAGESEKGFHAGELDDSAQPLVLLSMTTEIDGEIESEYRSAPHDQPKLRGLRIPETPSVQ